MAPDPPAAPVDVAVVPGMAANQLPPMPLPFVCPAAESVAWIWTLLAVPTVPVCVPGLVTVTVLPPVPMLKAKVAVPEAPVVSFTVTVTVLLPLAVGVPGGKQ